LRVERNRTNEEGAMADGALRTEAATHSSINACASQPDSEMFERPRDRAEQNADEIDDGLIGGNGVDHCI
jgi:hypothetical protein